MKTIMLRRLKLTGSALIISLLLWATPTFAAPYAQTGTTAQPQVTVKQLLQDGDNYFKNEQYDLALATYQKALAAAVSAAKLALEVPLARTRSG